MRFVSLVVAALVLLPAVLAGVLIPGTTTSAHYEAVLFMVLGFYIGTGFFLFKLVSVAVE